MRQNAAPPRGLLHNPAVTDGTSTHERILPPPALAHVIAHFWSVTWDLTQPKSVAALSHPTLHFVFEAPDRAELTGVPTRRFVRTLSGTGWVFGCKLRPAASRAFLAEPAAQFTDRVVPLTSVFGPVAADWARAIFAAPTLDARIDAIVPRLSAALRPLPEDAATLRDLVERIAIDPSLIRVEQLATLAHQTPRSLQRHFLAAVGVSPKWVIRRYRLHEAAERLRTSKSTSPPSLATLAAELGYADQAHFSRDFAAAVGQTPTQFLRALTL